ncbi:hypothetical protein C0992_004210 [Termitomyces sp. T32_za158]|nr:hypothetical protein C0992_004210 [Termitomyces sp. T32_za158]
MVVKDLAAYEPQKQMKSVLLYWRSPGEWAETLHNWATETAQLNTILTFYDITDPPIDSELSGIPIPLLRKAIGILSKTGRAQILGVADGEGVRILASKLATCQDEQVLAINNLAHCLARINQDSKAIKVEIAEKKLKKLTKTFDSNKSDTIILLEAVTDFRERIIPVFRRAEEQTLEIERLKVQLSKYQSEVAANARQIETLERKRDEACDLLQKTAVERDKAIDSSNQAVLKINQLRKDLIQIKAQESKLEDTRNLHKAQLLEHKDLVFSGCPVFS